MRYAPGTKCGGGRGESCARCLRASRGARHHRQRALRARSQKAMPLCRAWSTPAGWRPRPSRPGRRSPSSPPPAYDAINFGPGQTPQLRPPAATESGRRSPGWCTSYRDAGAPSAPDKPGPRRGLGTYPFVRLDEAKRSRGARRRADRLRNRRAARGDARVHPRGAGGRIAGARVHISQPRPRAGRRCARRSRAWADAPLRRLRRWIPDTEIIPTLGSKEAVFGTWPHVLARRGRSA